MKITLEIERGPEGWFYAASPQLPGVHVLEATLKDALHEFHAAAWKVWQEVKEADTEQSAAFAKVFKGKSLIDEIQL